MREAQAKQMHLEGHTQHDIARTLHVSQPAVSKMLKRIEERLLTDVAWRVDRQRARQTLRLEFIYRQAIQGWRASEAEGLRRRQRKTDGPGKHGGTTVAELISEHRNGDPRFLDEARRALADLRTLWGVDAPERLSVETTSRFASMSDADIEAELARQSVFLRRFLPAPAEAAPPQGERHEHEDEETQKPS